MRKFSKSGAMRAQFIVGVGLSLTVGLAGCSEEGTSTLLNPEGPPMVRQVFVTERVTVTTDTGSITRTIPQLAFGTHPDFTNENDSTGVTAAVARGSQRLRIVIDELLVGNALEEIACADGSFSRIPLGTTPDDIAKCAGKNLTKCTGDKAVCIGADGPLGILDENDDGAADDLQMIDGAVTLECDGQVMPHDLTQSFYQPSGNQQIPAGPIGIDGIGPAIIIIPSDQGLKTSSNCTLTFNAEVTDKSGNQICAPPGGDVNRTDDCAPGDTSKITFGVEPLRLTGNDPSDGATGIRLTASASTDSQVLLQFNAAIDAASLTAITLTEGGTAVATSRYTVELNPDDATIMTLTLTGGYLPLTEYVVTVASGATGIKDIHGGELPAPITITFTTRDSTPVPDAGAPDAEASDATPVDAGAPDA